MNFKKGLLRLWLVSLPIVFGWSYFSEAKQANAVAMTWYGFHQDAIRELNNPICREIANKSPIKFPELAYPNPCSQLSIFWEDLLELRKPNQAISKEDINTLFEKNWGSYGSKQGLVYGSIALVAYQLILIVLAVIFFVARWVFRGFKNNI